MTFSRGRKSISFSYSINGNTLTFTYIVENIHDLGFLFVPSLNPKDYIDYITCKILKMVDFIN